MPVNIPILNMAGNEELQNLNILVVQDDKIIRERLEGLLKMNYSAVHTATNCTDALNIFNSHNIELILSDYLLEDETGLDLFKQVRAIDDKVPFYIITGSVDKSIDTDLKKSGVDKIFYQPMVYDELKEEIDAQLVVSGETKQIIDQLARAQQAFQLSEKEGFFPPEPNAIYVVGHQLEMMGLTLRELWKEDHKVLKYLDKTMNK